MVIAGSNNFYMKIEDAACIVVSLGVRVSFMYCCWTRKSHLRNRIICQKRGSAKFVKIIQVRGWDFLVPQQYIMMHTFSCPLFYFLRFYMNSVSSAYFFRCLRLFQSKKKYTNEFSRCRKGCTHSLAPKNGSKIAFQASIQFLLGFETNVGISIY